MARGDRVRVERRLSGAGICYMHHGIDLGDGTVVHARPDDFRNPFGGGRVERVSLESFADGSPVRIVTEPAARFSPEVVAQRACGEVGRAGYCPAIDNCEHFATWCATGRRSSPQADIVLSRLGGAVARVAATLSARGVAWAADRAARPIVTRAALGGTIRLGLRSLVPAAIAAEAAALAVEWTLHHAGRSADESRSAGETAGLATSAAVCGLVSLATGPGAAVAAAAAGAAAWAAGGVATRAAASLADRHQGAW